MCYATPVIPDLARKECSVVPFTAAQRRLFHEADENPSAAERHGMSGGEAHRLADEADKLAREGKEKHTKTRKCIDEFYSAMEELSY
jgi:hypothetical protein